MGKLVEFFEKVGGAVLGVGELPKKTREALRKRRRGEPRIPEILKSYFEKRHAGFPEYVMFKAQIAILILFILTAIHIVLFYELWWAFIPAVAAGTGYVLWLAATQVKRAFTRDYPAYRSFLLMCVSVAWVFIFVLRYPLLTPSLENLYLSLLPPFIGIGFVMVAFTVFRFKYGRNFTFGVVERTRGGKAAVRVGYDICSNVKAGIYVIDSFVRVKKGDVVKLSVDRPLLGLRGSRVKAVIGRVGGRS
ncbi:MAG: DUF2101 family protein [Candidatus Hadarchaeales archaeon]